MWPLGCCLEGAFVPAEVLRVPCVHPLFCSCHLDVPKGALALECLRSAARGRLGGREKAALAALLPGGPKRCVVWAVPPSPSQGTTLAALRCLPQALPHTPDFPINLNCSYQMSSCSREVPPLRFEQLGRRGVPSCTAQPASARRGLESACTSCVS